MMTDRYDWTLQIEGHPDEHGTAYSLSDAYTRRSLVAGKVDFNYWMHTSTWDDGKERRYVYGAFHAPLHRIRERVANLRITMTRVNACVSIFDELKKIYKLIRDVL